MDDTYKLIRFRKITNPFFKGLSLVTTPVLGGFDTPFAPKDEKNCRLFVALIADVHMRWEDYRMRRFAFGLFDMEHSKRRLDALISVGDLTDHGETMSWRRTKEVFDKYDPADTFIMALGNHDTWTTMPDPETDGYDFASKLYLNYVEKLTGEKEEKVYYSKDVNGYKFIVLGSETSECDGCIGPEQIEWCDRELAEAAKTGKPVFVINHTPFLYTHGLPWTATKGKDAAPDEGGLKHGGDELKAVIRKYKNVLYISGHSHMGLSGRVSKHSSFEDVGGFYSLNLPCYMFPNHDGLRGPGYGYVLEVYDDEILLRCRSFLNGTWFPWYNFRMPIQ